MLALSVGLLRMFIIYQHYCVCLLFPNPASCATHYKDGIVIVREEWPSPIRCQMCIKYSDVDWVTYTGIHFTYYVGIVGIAWYTIGAAWMQWARINIDVLLFINNVIVIIIIAFISYTEYNRTYGIHKNNIIQYNRI